MIYWRDYKITKFEVFKHADKLYTNAICSFDVEVTTFFYLNKEWVVQDMRNTSKVYFKALSESEKIAVPYIWQFAINDDVIYGREITDFFEFIKRFKMVNSIGTTIIFVHNLGYDFEFICENLPADLKVFAKAPFRPMRVYSKSLGIEFRCSYMLTNMSLDVCAKEFNLGVEKTTELEYSVARLPVTFLSETELHYCENDVKIINAMIKKIFLERYENIANIPLTQTGEVRREVKALTKKIPYYMYNMNLIKPDLNIYKILTLVILGGYTHLNGLYNGKIIKNVRSFDKRSSYPDIMCTRKFPSEKWHKCDGLGDFEKYAFMFYVRFEKIQCQYAWAYISAHKCKSFRAKTDNGKIFSADWVEMWVTEQDYMLIKRDYMIEREIVGDIYKSYKKYLPKEIILYILELFGNKSSLKGLSDFQALYLRSKQLINAIFGLTLTNSVLPKIVFNSFSHLWENPDELTDSQIADLLKEQRPFLNFSIGAWVTAYGRADIFNVLLDINLDAVYSDTDSAKIRNAEKYRHIFEDYNKECEKRIDKVCKSLNINKQLFFPKNSKGIVQPLGFFEDEGEYTRFKSLGSKKYCYEQNGKFNFVVAGLRKSYLLNNEKIPTMTKFDEMDNANDIPHGRIIHWHNVKQPQVELTDYLGNKWVNTQKQGIAMLSTCYTFNITKDYASFVVGIRNKYTNYFRGGFDDENF